MPPRRITIPKLGLTAAAAAILVAADPARAQSPAADSLEALTVFRENIDAIHKRDHGRYLKTYLQTDQLTRGGLRGVERGWLSWTARTETNPAWPDTLIATEMRVAPLSPGVVYGVYRYRGVNKGIPAIGVSERIFVKTTAGWRIAFTASYPDSLPAR